VDSLSTHRHPIIEQMLIAAGHRIVYRAAVDVDAMVSISVRQFVPCCCGAVRQPLVIV
jgi:hypothetical protein